MSNVKKWILSLTLVSTATAGAAAQAHSHKAEPLPPIKKRLTGPSLNPHDEFLVESYDPQTRTYSSSVLLDDETAGPLIASRERLGEIL
ncbi:MAG: hypothetical protein QM773_13295 [Hyphomonadaceae bacterium]